MNFELTQTKKEKRMKSVQLRISNFLKKETHLEIVQ
jgi:hypothetical protein